MGDHKLEEVQTVKKSNSAHYYIPTACLKKPEVFGFKKRDSEVVITKVHQHQAVATAAVIGALLHLMHVSHNATDFVL
jgi:hypothetical protein